MIPETIKVLLEECEIKFIDNQEYKTNKIHYNFMCKNYHIFKTTINNIKRTKKCNDCKDKKREVISLDKLKHFTERYNGKIISDKYKCKKENLTWKCSNIFHKEFEASTHNIYNIKSWCPAPGCANKKNEHICRTIIEHLFTFYKNDSEDGRHILPVIDQEKEFYSIGDLINITNYNKEKYYFMPKRPEFLKLSDENIYERLEIDCYNEELKLGIEYNGIQHYEYDSYLHKGDIKNLHKQQLKDKIKENLCEENNIKLIMIPYWEVKKSLNYTKNYIYNILKNLGYEFNITYNNFMIDEYNYLRNKIYNNYGGTNLYKLINIIEKDLSQNLNYQYSKHVLNIENNVVDRFNIICNKGHNYDTNYNNVICSHSYETNRKRNCLQCAPNSSINNEIINERLSPEFEIINLYTGKSGELQSFKCLTCNFVFNRSWENMNQLHRRTCDKCLNPSKYMVIYQYSISLKKIINEYSSLDEIRISTQFSKPNDIHSIKNNCLKKTKSFSGFIWSFNNKVVETKKNNYRKIKNDEDDLRKQNVIWRFNQYSNEFEKEYLNARCIVDDLGLITSSILRATQRVNKCYAGYKWKLKKDLTETELNSKKLTNEIKININIEIPISSYLDKECTQLVNSYSDIDDVIEYINTINPNLKYKSIRDSISRAIKNNISYKNYYWKKI